MHDRALAAPRTLSLPGRPDGRRVAAWLLGLAPVAYLGLDGGGYDVIVRSQVGIALWWIVLLGALVGVLPAARTNRLALTATCLLAAFAAWSLLSVIWAEDPERGVSEAVRTVTLAGLCIVTVLGIRSDQVRTVLSGAVCGIVAIAVIALLSRLAPDMLSPQVTGDYLESSRKRLSYPVNYWNALAALMAMGVPLALGIAHGARTALGRALALAPIPTMVLAGSLALSRSGILSLILGLVAVFAVTASRWRFLALAGIAGASSSIVVGAAAQREQVRDGLTSAVAERQGREMLAVLLVVTLGVAMLAAATWLAEHAWTLPRPFAAAGRAGRNRLAVALAALLVVVSSAAGASRTDWSARWDAFTSPASVVNDSSRLSSGGGNGRWQLWQAAWDGVEEHPLVGLGSGSFSTYWSRNATIPGQIHNAHNLYLETLAELGIVGTLLLVAFFGALLAGAVLAARRAWPELRPAAAGGTGALVAFAVFCVFDWGWQVTALPTVAVLVGGSLLAARSAPQSSGAPLHTRVPLVITAAAAIVALLIPLAAASALRQSQQDATAQLYPQAIGGARDASAVQPYASSPLLQRALILERAGAFDAAATAARRAAEKSPLDWRPYLTLSRIEAEAGHTGAALAAYRRLRELNKAYGLLR